MDFFRFKDLLSSENQRGDEDSFLVPLKNNCEVLKFRSTRQFTYHYSWAYAGIVETLSPIYISSAQCPFTRREKNRDQRGEERERQEEEKGRRKRDREGGIRGQCRTYLRTEV